MQWRQHSATVHDHITSHLFERMPSAHMSTIIRGSPSWLPVNRCIQFKILTLICNCLVGSAPHYILRLLHSAWLVPVGRLLLYLYTPGGSQYVPNPGVFFLGTFSWNRLTQNLWKELLSLSSSVPRALAKLSCFSVMSDDTDPGRECHWPCWVALYNFDYK